MGGKTEPRRNSAGQIAVNSFGFRALVFFAFWSWGVNSFDGTLPPRLGSGCVSVFNFSRQFARQLSRCEMRRLIGFLACSCYFDCSGSVRQIRNNNW